MTPLFRYIMNSLVTITVTDFLVMYLFQSGTYEIHSDVDTIYFSCHGIIRHKNKKDFIWITVLLRKIFTLLVQDFHFFSITNRKNQRSGTSP